jgi:hypothetical protein
MNVARSEMSFAINALLDNFPRMRVDPDAPTPELLGTSDWTDVAAMHADFSPLGRTSP